MVAIRNWISLSWIDGLIKSIKNQINKGTTKLIKLVIKNFTNSFNPPSNTDSLKIIFRDKKYETITPIENTKIFVKYGESLPDITDEVLKKYQNAPYRAPMIIILVNTIKKHPKVPAIEQKLSTATAAQNIMLALNAMNYSSIWRTGKFAFNKMVQAELGLESNQEILGYLYIGTEIGKKKEIPSLDIDKFVRYL